MSMKPEHYGVSESRGRNVQCRVTTLRMKFVYSCNFYQKTETQNIFLYISYMPQELNQSATRFGIIFKP